MWVRMIPKYRRINPFYSLSSQCTSADLTKMIDHSTKLPQPIESKMCEEIDRLYRERRNLDSVRQSIRLIESKQNSAQSHDLQWRPARAYFFLGQESKEC